MFPETESKQATLFQIAKDHRELLSYGFPACGLDLIGTNKQDPHELADTARSALKSIMVRLNHLMVQVSLPGYVNAIGADPKKLFQTVLDGIDTR